jgi:hypothetical protein
MSRCRDCECVPQQFCGACPCHEAGTLDPEARTEWGDAICATHQWQELVDGECVECAEVEQAQAEAALSIEEWQLQTGRGDWR